MKTQFRINFDTAEIRSLLIKQAKDNNAIPANVKPESLEMRISPRTGVTFLPSEGTESTGSDQNSGGDTPPAE